MCNTCSSKPSHGQGIRKSSVFISCQKRATPRNTPGATGLPSSLTHLRSSSRSYNNAWHHHGNRNNQILKLAFNSVMPSVALPQNMEKTWIVEKCHRYLKVVLHQIKESLQWCSLWCKVVERPTRSRGANTFRQVGSVSVYKARSHCANATWRRRLV